METRLQPVDESPGIFATPENGSFPFKEVYKPLSSSQKEIRLVEILPGSQHDPLSLNLLHGCFLAEISHNFYEALSYCVGDVTRFEKIMFHGHEFDVFESLYEALSQIRALLIVLHALFISISCASINTISRKRDSRLG